MRMDLRSLIIIKRTRVNNDYEYDYNHETLMSN